MEAKERSIRYFAEGCYYVVPIFQRKYVWKENNWELFWNELISTDPEQSFFGTFIVQEGKKLRSAEKTIEKGKCIIDGQQRLTTISILVKVMMEHYKKHGNYSVLAKLSDFLFKTEQECIGFESTKEEHVKKLNHSLIDYKHYNEIINNELDLSTIIDDEDDNKYSNLKACYKFFHKKVNSAKPHEIENIIKIINNDQVKPIVVIELSENEDPQRIFDTTNSTGCPLTISDIIKNAVFENYPFGRNEDVQAIYNSTWKEAFEADEETTKFWLNTKGTGANARTYIDSFFKDFALIKKFHSSSDNSKLIASEYKDYLRTKCDDEAKKTFLKEICEYAKKYKEIFICETNSFDKNYVAIDKTMSRLLMIFDYFNVNSFDAFLLKVAVNKENKSADEINAELKKLETFFMRHQILHTDHRKSFHNDTEKLLGNKSDSLNYADFCQDLSDSKLKKSLENIRNKYARIILYWLEIFNRSKEENKDDDRSDQPLIFNPFQVEHIMPVKWKEKWNKILDESGNEINDDLVCKIGNMTLLNGKLNDEISNSDFQHKLNGNNGQGGIKQKSNLLITRDLLSKSSWGKEEIVNRTNDLFNLFCEMWPITLLN